MGGDPGVSLYFLIDNLYQFLNSMPVSQFSCKGAKGSVNYATDSEEWCNPPDTRLIGTSPMTLVKGSTHNSSKVIFAFTLPSSQSCSVPLPPRDLQISEVTSISYFVNTTIRGTAFVICSESVGGRV